MNVGAAGLHPPAGSQHVAGPPPEEELQRARLYWLLARPLAALRGDLASLGIARSAEVKEPEDHIAALCEVMAGLIDGTYGLPQPVAAQHDFFAAHIAPWAGRFFADLARAEAAAFYTAVAELGRSFIEIERTAFAMED